MKRNTRWALIALVAASWLLVAYCYPLLPDLMPIHWNLNGQIDGWGQKNWAAFLLPAVISFTALLAVLLPAISPTGFRLDGSRHALAKLIFWICLFLLAVQYVTCQAGLQPEFPVIRWLLASTGGLLIATGNLLTKFPRNFFVGVRTPWTLTNDCVWDKTHRLARTTFMLVGFLLIAAALAGWYKNVWLLGASVLALLVPVVYSYLLYRRLDEQGG